MRLFSCALFAASLMPQTATAGGVTGSSASSPVYTQSTNALLSVGSAAAGTVPDNVLAAYENGAGAMTTGQVSIANTATLIAAAASGGTSLGVDVQNCNSVDLYVGGSGVTTATGYKIPASPYPGQCNSKSFPFSGAVYGIFATGTQTVGYVRYN